MESGVDGVSAVGADHMDVALSDVTNKDNGVGGTDGAYSAALTQAIERATEIPAAQLKTEGPLVEMSGTASGDFGNSKRELLSDVEREGAKSENTPDEGGEVEEVAEAMRSLMNDLTTWQVTWNMAQTAQKDVTHILKSS